MTIFFETTITENVKVSPSLLNSNLDKNVLNILKNKYEGICTKYGYIRTNSIKLVSVDVGTIEMFTFHGYVLFNVTFIAAICNPTIGSIVKGKVKNTNSFGILCVSGFHDGLIFHDILNIVIPRNNNQESNANFDGIKINDEVNIEILGKKYTLHNKNINIFGKIIDYYNESDEDINLDNLNTDATLDSDDEENTVANDDMTESDEENNENNDNESFDDETEEENDVDEVDSNLSDIDVEANNDVY